jgi:hypothetical protein
MVKHSTWKCLLLALFVLIACACYFAICSAPAGSPFIYVDF